MRTVTIRGVPEPTLKALHAAAAANRRSLNGELLALLDQAAASAPPIVQVRAGAQSGRTGAQRKAGAPSPTAPDPKTLAALCRRYHVRWLGVFGSSARGEATPGSDVDVVVEFEPGLTPGLGFVTLAEGLRPVFGGRPVDLVTSRGLSPRIRERVLAEAVTLYGAR